MFPSQALRVLAVALPLLLPVLAQQQPAAAFQHLLEKRSSESSYISASLLPLGFETLVLRQQHAAPPDAFAPAPIFSSS